MSSARVRSIEALADLKSALCTFAAEAKEALSSVAMDIRRAQSWLDDQMKFWGATVRKCQDDLFQAKQELSRRKMMRIGDRPLDCTEQEEAFQLAKERLAYAEDKLETTRRWLRQLPEAVIDYDGPANQLTGLIEGQLPKADALLEQKITALEEYTRIASEAPTAARGLATPLSPPGRGVGGEGT